MAEKLPTDRAARWKSYRRRDWPTVLRYSPSNTETGRERWAEFEEYKAMAADRQAKALLLATRILAAATLFLVAATAVLAYITAAHTGR